MNPFDITFTSEMSENEMQLTACEFIFVCQQDLSDEPFVVYLQIDEQLGGGGGGLMGLIGWIDDQSKKIFSLQPAGPTLSSRQNT